MRCRTRDRRTWRSREKGWQALTRSLARKLLNQAAQGAVKLFPRAVSKGRAMAVCDGALGSVPSVFEAVDDDDDDDDSASPSRRCSCINEGGGGGGRLSTMRNDGPFHAGSDRSRCGLIIGIDGARGCRSSTSWAVAVPRSREMDARNSVRDRKKCLFAGDAAVVVVDIKDAGGSAKKRLACCFFPLVGASVPVLSPW